MKIQLLVFSILILTLFFLVYNNIVSKRLDVSIIFAVLTLTLEILLLALARKKEALLVELGLNKRFGKGNRFNYLSIIDIAIGSLWIIPAFLILPNFTQMIFNITVGLGWKLIGVGNRSRYYLQINEKYITKLKLDSIKLEKIESIEYMNDKLAVKKGYKIMEIFFNEFTLSEKEMLIEELSKRFKIDNLPDNLQQSNILIE